MSFMDLTGKQKRFLRARGHSLKPVVRIGNEGFSEAVRAELDGALEHHELLKIKLPAEERIVREQLLDAICSSVRAHCVQILGHSALLYRPRTDGPGLTLPR